MTKWLQAICLLTQSKNDLSALSIKGDFGVCNRIDWRLKRKRREVMALREAARLLDCVGFADDAALGGVAAGNPGVRLCEQSAVHVLRGVRLSPSALANPPAGRQRGPQQH